MALLACTCFIFAEHLDDEYGLSLKMDEQGQIVEPLIKRTIDELRVLQENAHTIVVLPTALSSLYQLELPWLSDHKARSALPYALEDQLAESVTSLHFAFDRQHYQHDRYLVVVIDKQVVIDLMHRLERLQLNFEIITLDWFALNLGESCVIGKTMLVHDVLFKGALSIDLLDYYLKDHTTYSHIHIFNDSIPVKHAEEFTQVDKLTYQWVAERLLKQKPMNLCQGELQHHTHQDQTVRWYRRAMILGGAWLVGLLFMKAVMWVVLNHYHADYQQKIAVLYHQFFPNARQVVSPRFRVEQLLKQSQRGDDTGMWRLLAKFTQAAFPTKSTTVIAVQHLQFQTNTLSVTFLCDSFSALEQLETRLQQEHVTMHQVSAAMQGKQVVATLEIS